MVETKELNLSTNLEHQINTHIQRYGVAPAKLIMNRTTRDGLLQFVVCDPESVETSVTWMDIPVQLDPDYPDGMVYLKSVPVKEPLEPSLS